jgi:pyridine nucleotide-disulfide oxidoreductase family protein
MKRLILVGGGHAHLHILKSLAARRWPGAGITLVSPYSRQIYSGMVPGWIAGHYSLDQCAAALAPLAEAAGARFIKDSVTGIDAGRRRVRCATSEDIDYDVLSVDSGALADHSCLAATGATLLPIRPLENFVVGWTKALERFRERGSARVVVVGGGAAGVELALAVRHRLAGTLGADHAHVVLVVGAGVLPGFGPRVLARVVRKLERYGVAVISGYAAGTADGIQLEDGREIAADCVLVATGVRPAGWLADSGLALAGDGFVAVADGQQSTSHPEVFAAGDVASRIDAPHAKSGVYAVRAGPVLTANLQRALAGQAPLAYQPQKRSLYLLATGPREAIMAWGRYSAGGRWAWRWKDWIDRRFMKQYDLSPE